MKSRAAFSIFLALFALGALAASDAMPRKYAVMSLIGDSLTIVTYRPSTGSNIDQNLREVVPLAPSELENSSLLAAQEAIKKTDPTSVVVLLAPITGTAQADRSKILQDHKFTPTEELGTALNNEAVTHLLLITKHRAEANLRMDRAATGSGMLEGLGYYVDRHLHLKRSDTYEVGVGFLAPYAYFTVSCIDVATATVLKQQHVTATATLSSARNKNGVDPWGVLSSVQKITTLRGLIGRELAKAIPVVMQP